MSQRRHWAVLFLGSALDRTDARYHEWFAPGVTACNRTWFTAGYGMRHATDEKPATWVHRRNAEQFALPCQNCVTVMEATRETAASG